LKLRVELNCSGDFAAAVITAEEVASPTIILPVTFFLPEANTDNTRCT